MSWHKTTRIIMLMVGAALAVAGFSSLASQASAKTIDSSKLKVQRLDSSSRRTITLGEALKDRSRTIVFFYASWCKRCQPLMINLEVKLKAAGVKDGLLLLSIDESPQAAKSFLSQVKSQLTKADILLDRQAKLPESLGLRGLPAVAVYHQGALMSVFDIDVDADLVMDAFNR